MTDRGISDGHERAGLIAGIAIILLMLLSATLVVSIFFGFGW